MTESTKALIALHDSGQADKHDEIELQAEVPSLYLPKIAAGQTVRVQTTGGEVIGRVKRVASEVDQVNQLGHVRAALAPRT